LRHSPNSRSGPAAYSSQRPIRPLITGFTHAFHTCGRLPAVSRLPARAGVGYRLSALAAPAPGRPGSRLPRAHPDREGRRRPHQAIERRVEQTFGLI